MRNKVLEGQLTISDIDINELYKKLGKQLVMKSKNGDFLGSIIFPETQQSEYIKHNDFDENKIREIETLLNNNNLGLTTRLVVAMLEEHGYKKVKYYLDNMNKVKVKTIAELNSAIRENMLNGVI
jgi:hypothetical protein